MATMRPTPKNADRLAEAWPPEMGIRERGMQLGWIGPFTPAEWAYLTWNSDVAKTYLGEPEYVSPERERIRKGFDEVVAELEQRVEMCEIRYAQELDVERERHADAERRRFRHGNAPTRQLGEGVMFAVPAGGPAENARVMLQQALTAIGDVREQRTWADAVQLRIESTGAEQ